MVAVFVLTAFLLILTVDLIVLRVQGKYHPAFEPKLSQLYLPIFERDSFNVPSNIFLSKGHTWLQPNKDGLVSIGIDEFGSQALGTLSILACPDTGKEIKRGDVLFEGTYGNKIVKFLSPINGIVNSNNKTDIGKNITNPYKTWVVKLLSSDLDKNRDKFLIGNDAINWMKKESSKLKSFINNHLPKVEAAGATMFDGGSFTTESITSLDEVSIADFEKEFLSL